MDEYNSLPEEEKPNYDIKNLGDGVELIGYNDENGNVDLSQAFTKSSYKFDGIDDYIKIKYDGSKSVEIKDEGGAIIGTKNEKEFLNENGFTIEFYGTIKGGNSYDERNGKEYSGSTIAGLLGWWNGNNMVHPQMRMNFVGITGNNPTFTYSPIYGGVWNFGVNNSDSKVYYSNGMDGEYWNYSFDLSGVSLGDDIYFALVVDPTDVFISSNEEKDFKNLCMRTRFYLNDNDCKQSELNVELWNFLFSENINDLKCFMLGRCALGTAGFWHYLKGECYSLRFYNTALTEEQIRENEEKTKDYHDILASEE